VAVAVALSLTLTSCAIPDDVEELVNGDVGIDLRIYTSAGTWAYWVEFTQDVGSPALAAGDMLGGTEVLSVEGSMPDAAHPDAHRIISTAIWVVTVGITSMTVYATTGFTRAIAHASSLNEGLVEWTTRIGITVTASAYAVVGGVLGLAQVKSINHAKQAVEQRSPDGCVKWKFGGDALLQTTLDGTPTFMGKAGNVAFTNGFCDGSAGG
jgi:hypothetical protein